MGPIGPAVRPSRAEYGLGVDPERDVRLLTRAKWVGVLLPIGLIWAFELARYFLIDPSVPADSAHVFAALVMSGGAVLFALGIFAILDRTQRQLVDTNRDLAATHAVDSALQGDQGLPAILEAALNRVLEHTGALAGQIRVSGPGGQPMTVRRPGDLGDSIGMQWAHTILDETPALAPRPAQTQRPGVDASVVDLPLAGSVATVGTMRLVFHPSADPAISMAALVDLAGTIGTAATLTTSLADLRREEHERAALYAVALQLTGRAELREILDTITQHARELLGAERAVACLANPRVDGESYDWTDRLALADDGSTCLLAHPAAEGDIGRHNPACPIQHDGPQSIAMARPLHGADGFLGELCVVRRNGVAFTDRERELLAALADMAAIAVGTARLREAEQQFTIVAERDRIARELHDSIAQVLGVIHLRLRSLEAEVRDVAGLGAATEIADLAEIADEGYKDVREAILGLSESITSADGLEGALGEYLRKYARQTGIKTTLSCDEAARRALTPRGEVQLLRVVQEALTNVRKHARAHHAAVSLSEDEGAVTLTVVDDGSGFDPSRLKDALDHGFGLASMRERVEQIGGTLEVHTAPGMGTRVVVQLQQEETRAAHAPDAARVGG
jgi:nitrate/nitrite-specific signal transduction histidine kinase